MVQPTTINHIELSPFYSFGGDRPKQEHAPITTSSIDAVCFMCGSLKSSLSFYSRLLGIDAAPERISGPVCFLPLRDDKLLVLMDRRLDLIHADWRPTMYIRVPNVDKAYEDARSQGWTIVNFLDKGGLFTNFFIAADADGHQMVVGSHPLLDSFPLAGSTPTQHSIVLAEGPLPLAVKEPLASSRSYAALFGPGLTGKLRFLDKYAPGSSIRLRFDACDEEKAYRLLRNGKIAVSQSTVDRDSGKRECLIHDPDGNPIAIRFV